MDPVFKFCDDLGPEKILHLYEPASDLRAIVVIDNIAAGPSIGGTRMAPDVSLEECVRLARAMTLKNAAAGLAHGGGKSVIFADPDAGPEQKERLIRAFARCIRNLRGYIAGPDMGTDETCMAWVQDSIGRAVGLPRELGGIPLDEIGATGLGLAVALETAQDYSELRLDGARVVVQGFGSVGIHAARYLQQRGCRLVGVSDSRGARHDPEGFDLEALIAFKRQGKPVANFAGGKRISAAELIGLPCDVWIPAARPDVITEANAGQLQARVVAQGANIPCTAAAERLLAQRNVLVLPDFIANAGGVICASVEYHGGSEQQALATIEAKIRHNTKQVLEQASSDNLLPRESAVRLAKERVMRAMTYRKYR